VAVLSVAFWMLGWKTVLVAYGLPYYLAAMAGVWLFYVQHQFEDAYWTSHGDWDYATAALRGTSSSRRRCDGSQVTSDCTTFITWHRAFRTTGCSAVTMRILSSVAGYSEPVSDGDE